MVKFPLPENIVKVTNRNQKGKCITVKNGNICLKNIFECMRIAILRIYKDIQRRSNILYTYIHIAASMSGFCIVYSMTYG